MEKVNLNQKLQLFQEHWKPKIVGELKGQMVKLVKFQGPFVWHHHGSSRPAIRACLCAQYRQCDQRKDCPESRTDLGGRLIPLKSS